MLVCDSCENNIKVMMTLMLIPHRPCERIKSNLGNNITKSCMELLAIEILKKDYDAYRKIQEDNEGFK